MDEEMSRLMRLPEAEFVRVIAAQEAQAQAERAARATAPNTSSRSFVGLPQNRSASSAANEAWLADQLKAHGKNWLRMAT